MTRLSSLFMGTFVVLVMLFLMAPIVVVVLASFNAGNFLTFPPQGLSLRWFWVFLDNEVFRRAIAYSAILAVSATAISLVVHMVRLLQAIARRARGEALTSWLA